MSGARFTHRRSETGWGVWDHTVHGWRSETSMTEDAARDTASAMNSNEIVRLAEQRLRSQPVYRTDGCPRPVHVYRETQYGREWYARRTLVAWVWTGRAWMGDILAPDGSTKWEPAELLEPARQLGPYD